MDYTVDPPVTMNVDKFCALVDAGATVSFRYDPNLAEFQLVAAPAPAPVPVTLNIAVGYGSVFVTVPNDFPAVVNPDTPVDVVLAWAPGSTSAQVVDKSNVFLTGAKVGPMQDWTGFGVAPMNVDKFTAWVDEGGTASFLLESASGNFGVATYTPPAP
jgi:hypothetical protein